MWILIKHINHFTQDTDFNDFITTTNKLWTSKEKEFHWFETKETPVATIRFLFFIISKAIFELLHTKTYIYQLYQHKYAINNSSKCQECGLRTPAQRNTEADRCFKGLLKATGVTRPRHKAELQTIKSITRLAG